MPQCAMEPQVHPQDDFAGLVARATADQLAEEVEQIVQQHEAECCRDKDPIGPTDPLHDGVIRSRGGAHMNGADGVVGFVGSLVTMPTRCAEIRGVNGGARIGRLEDVVDAVTRRTVRNRDFSAFQRQAVVAVGIRGNPICGEVV